MAGLDEAKVSLVEDDYANTLTASETAALTLTDAFIGMPGTLTAEQKEALQAEFSDAEITELMLGVGLFLGMSKVLIALGLEPEEMPITVLPTPGA